MITIDSQFKVLKDRNLVGAPFNVCSKEEYIHNIEQWYRTVKERYYCYYMIITFKYLPQRIVVELMITVSFYVNTFIWKYGISEVLLPLMIVEGVVLDFYLHFRIIYGKFYYRIVIDTNLLCIQP